MEAILATLKAIIDNFGSAIIVPFIIFIIALIFKVKVQKAFLSALYAGVSLMGFTLILGAFTPIITPMVKNMSQVMAGVTGVNLNTFDVGWQATRRCLCYQRGNDLSGSGDSFTDDPVPCKVDEYFSAVGSLE